METNVRTVCDECRYKTIDDGRQRRYVRCCAPEAPDDGYIINWDDGYRVSRACPLTDKITFFTLIRANGILGYHEATEPDDSFEHLHYYLFRNGDVEDPVPSALIGPVKLLWQLIEGMPIPNDQQIDEVLLLRHPYGRWLYRLLKAPLLNCIDGIENLLS